jgi:hypothetical protein
MLRPVLLSAYTTAVPAVAVSQDIANIMSVKLYVGLVHAV